jgi:CTP:molybdopterin cytidylyltransferase MocA
LPTPLNLAIATSPGTACDAANWVKPEDRLIDAFDAAPVEPIAAVLERGGRRGTPVLLGHALFPAVRMLEGDKGARPHRRSARKYS